uniref:Integrin alpha-IIb-like n=1 Tax=Sparus aurata TaxID=8175 RepID=A0A671V4C4_SPAAU
RTDRQTGVMCVLRCVCVLLCVGMCVCLNLLDEPAMFSGPTGSLFGFSLDFHTSNNSVFVVIGAPKANTSQSGVTEGGSVFLCPWSPGGRTCDIIDFDLEGEFLIYLSGLFFHTFKSHQWFGATVRSACAPLFHWNVQSRGAESGKTPVGNCLLLDQKTGSSTSFSPCKGSMMDETYKLYLIKLLCVCVCVCVLQEGRLLLGAPGSFYFQGESRPLLCSDVIEVVSCHFMVRLLNTIIIFQVLLYLQRRGSSFSSQPDQSLIGLSLYGRFGSALAVLGDLDMDGYHDVAVGAPWSGDNRQGQVFIYLGNIDGLSATPSQVIDSPLQSNKMAFGFTLRGGADIDNNGYPDLLVGAWAADRAFLYRSRAVIRSRVSLSLLPDFLNPEDKLCQRENTPVTCFVIQVCVHLSGHRIPQQTVLGVELQLDKMKQPMARRTLLLSTNQPQETVRLTVQSEVGVACINQTAYLRSEEDVQDKLSPIFITVNISLLNTTQHALLHGQTHASAQTRIILNCGDDNICVPDLKLTAEPLSDSVLVGGDQSVLLSVSAQNDGEGAYETELVVQIPEHTHFQSSQVILVCVQRKENQTVIVTCDLGNPMRQGHTTGLLFSVGHLEEVESHITFNLKIRSKNSVNSSSNEVSVEVQVKAEASLEIRGGSSPPEVVLPLPDWLPAEHPGSLEDVGPLVEHVYELRNQGPSAVNARLTVDFPSTWRHHFLLYVFSNASEESLSCRTLNASQLDPFKVQKLSVCLSASLTCLSDTGCIRFVCDVIALGRSFSAVIRISARLWTHTLAQTPYLNYELVSSASYDVINASSKVQLLLLPSGHTQVPTHLSVSWRPPDGEKNIPIGYIVLSVVSGLLLLSMLSVVFWKLGFFNRTRPPTDDDDDDDDEDEEQRLAEESRMTE